MESAAERVHPSVAECPSFSHGLEIPQYSFGTTSSGCLR